MKTTIKRADLSDLELLLRWRAEVLREVFSLSSGDSLDELIEENRRYYETKIPSGEHVACFAYSGTDIVGTGGLCLYREMPSPENPKGTCAYLMNVFTRPDLRGRGIGRDLVSWLLWEAQKLGCRKIYLETTSAGRQLYEKLGFTDMPGYMKLEERK